MCRASRSRAPHGAGGPRPYLPSRWVAGAEALRRPGAVRPRGVEDSAPATHTHPIRLGAVLLAVAERANFPVGLAGPADGRGVAVVVLSGLVGAGVGDDQEGPAGELHLPLAGLFPQAVLVQPRPERRGLVVVERRGRRQVPRPLRVRERIDLR